MKSLRHEIIEWNSKFPIDRWWRERHNIPFMSSAHKEASFIDMLFEFEEERLISDMLYDNQTYTPNIGKWIDTSNQTKEQRYSSIADETRNELSKLNNARKTS